MNKCFISSVGNQNQNQKNKLTRDETFYFLSNFFNQNLR